jgi:hypothetical protein
MKHIEFRKKGKIIGPYCAGAAFTIPLHIICEQRRNGTGTVRGEFKNKCESTNKN